jgi:hypothetical protein
VAGTGGEARAAAYVQEQMERAGLEVAVEPFEFRSFTLQNAVLAAGGAKGEIVRGGFNPYAGGGRVGALAFVESTDRMGDVLAMDLDDKIVVTTERANLYAIAIVKKPGAVAALRAADFARLRATGGSKGEIVVQGKTVARRSANIVGKLRSGLRDGPEIVLSAHYDSWRGPGANDNASGVAVLLELARLFAAVKPAPPMRMSFVAFGGEELGMLGSRAYLEKHEAELRDCRLLFNMDTVGGGNAIYVETRGGVKGVPARVASQLPRQWSGKATSDIDARWMLVGAALGPLFDSANVPEWLSAAVMRTGKELNLEIKPSRGMGSDHRVFVQAGVVATNIAISGPGTHTAGDVPEALQPDSLEKAARIVSAVVEKAMRVAPGR